MSRSRYGYSEDCENLELYRGTVDRCLSGKRGQSFLRELANALDAMPEKRLIAEELVRSDGSCCAIGAVCIARGMDVTRIDYEDPRNVERAMGIAWQMAAEIAYENDEGGRASETEEARWVRLRSWVRLHLKGDELKPLESITIA